MNSLGKKLLITGKGRCNITSSLEISEFINNIPGNGRFLYSSFENFSNIDIINLLKEEGLDVKEERGNRIFPITDKSSDVLNALINRMKKLNIEIRTNAKVEEIIVNESEVEGVELSAGEIIKGSKVILATGGKSYPLTGSTGDGYKIAEKVGHTITEIKPSIVPLTADREICAEMQGLSLRNVKITIKDVKNNKKIYEDFGEMLFTHFGVSGPTILSSSAHLLRYKEINKLLNDRNVKLIVDLKPALSKEELDLRVRRDFEEVKNKQYKNSLDNLLPQKMIPVFIKYTNIKPEKKVNEITKEERRKIVESLKRILEEYDSNYKAYENGEKEFIIEKKYLYSLKEAVYQAISDKYCSDDLLSEFKDFLDEEYNKWRK
jgi:predicted Rossmann fold flavoprotein